MSERGAVTVSSARDRLNARLDALRTGEVDRMIPAGDYFFQALDEYLTDTGAWRATGLRHLKREVRRVRMARKRRRGWA